MRLSISPRMTDSSMRQAMRIMWAKIPPLASLGYKDPDNLIALPSEAASAMSSATGIDRPLNSTW